MGEAAPERASPKLGGDNVMGEMNSEESILH
jgi:hypothetical protein